MGISTITHSGFGVTTCNWQEGDQELLLFGALVQGGSLVLRVVRALFTLLEALVCSEVDTAAS